MQSAEIRRSRSDGNGHGSAASPHVLHLILKGEAYDHVYSQAELESYRCEPGWTQWYESLQAGSDSWVRAAKIQELRPSARAKQGGEAD